jgi:predicted metalloendopeptidase
LLFTQTYQFNKNTKIPAGLQASYKAYKKILNGKEEKRVKGYERYTNDQAFFISYATVSFLLL